MVSRKHIQAFVDQVVRRFRPGKVILFGSYAYGHPSDDSDVDLMWSCRIVDQARKWRPASGLPVREVFRWI